ncbi:hypothetical protein [Vibrio lentus]|uniref:hypothetical protein n=1 Tax=Vibrio lentus TaxID=136468 RepID=UPI000C8374B4|nr:hypothetical protein [Vibrio lentus]PMI15261.1 hypothetical protein BCU51_18370 [Vibrio lentus]PMK36321.1 hypothetical protein BCU02_01370 [Vibrio lentus]
MKWILILIFCFFSSYSFSSQEGRYFYFKDIVSCTNIYFTYDGLSSAVTGCKLALRNEIITGATWKNNQGAVSLVSKKSTGASRWTNAHASTVNLTSCSSINPEFQEIDGVCKKPEIGECPKDEYHDEENNVCVPISKCPKADTFHKKLTSGSEKLSGTTCVSNNCVIKIKYFMTIFPRTEKQLASYNTFYTGQSCVFDPNNPEIKPEDHVWDESPVINPDDPNLVPTPDDPDLPPIGSDPSPTDPTPTPEAPKPNPNPTPTPDNPNLSEAENDLVGGISVTNQHLENIDDNIDRLRAANDANAKEDLKYQQHILGELQNGTGSGGGGSGGDGEGEGGCDPDKSTCESDLNFGEPEVTNPFEDILSAEDIVAINQKTDDVKGLINQKINSFKSLVSTPNYGVGGEVEGVVVEANHYGKSIKMEQNFLSRSSGDFSTIIILICGIIAFGVVARR